MADCLVRPAPLVRPLVGVGDEKLVNQVPLAAHDLHAVVARRLRELRAPDKVVDDDDSDDIEFGTYPLFRLLARLLAD